MSFTSFTFVVCFPALVVAHYLLPERFRWVLLLAVSYAFYAGGQPGYLPLLAGNTWLVWWVARRMGGCADKRARRPWLLLIIAVNLGLLWSLKYYNFFCRALQQVLAPLAFDIQLPGLNWLAPLGLSFFTLQCIGYAVDVYRGTSPAVGHLGKLALFFSFFPLQTSGPIERSNRFLPQLWEKRGYDPQRIVGGLTRMLWGLFQKMVIADRLAIYVNAVYDHPGDYGGWPVVLATYFFALQIFADFSGYTDLALGAARVLGYALMENFRRPYFARSLADFWHRWHISLSTWLRDYLYNPLGGSWRGRYRWWLNLLLVFLASGLWHGAGWTFLAWGLLHGLYLLVSLWTMPLRQWLREASGLARRPRLQRLWQIAVTFHLVAAAWIFFRAPSLHCAGAIIAGMFRPYRLAGFTSPLGDFEFGVALTGMAAVVGLHLCQGFPALSRRFGQAPLPLRWALFSALALGVIFYGKTGHTPFIYLRF